VPIPWGIEPIFYCVGGSAHRGVDRVATVSAVVPEPIHGAQARPHFPVRPRTGLRNATGISVPLRPSLATILLSA